MLDWASLPSVSGLRRAESIGSTLEAVASLGLLGLWASQWDLVSPHKPPSESASQCYQILFRSRYQGAQTDPSEAFEGAPGRCRCGVSVVCAGATQFSVARWISFQWRLCELFSAVGVFLAPSAMRQPATPKFHAPHAPPKQATSWESVALARRCSANWRTNWQRSGVRGPGEACNLWSF